MWQFVHKNDLLLFDYCFSSHDWCLFKKKLIYFLIFNFFYLKAVEYLSEWSLCPTNLVYQRVQTSVYDPSNIGDKPKWYAHQLQPVGFHVYDNSSTLGAALTSVTGEHSDDNPTDESGSDSDGAESTSSSYSSLSDFVSDLYNSDIRGETPCKYLLNLYACYSLKFELEHNHFKWRN